MHADKLSFDSNPNIGLFAFANDEFCLVGHEIHHKHIQTIKKVLKVDVFSVSLCGTSLVGVFCAGNSRKILVPEICFDSEIDKLKQLGINFEIIKTKMTALGNNILCNDYGALVNPDFSADIKKRIRQVLDVKLKPGRIAGLENVGCCCAGNKKGLLIHRDVSEQELNVVEDLLKVKATTGTVNFGSPYIRSGVICNSNGFLIGEVSGGPEIQNADEALGLLQTNQ